MQHGFLLIEMLVAVAVVLIVATIAITERDDFSHAVALDNVAYEVALAIRQAQSYGISSRGSDIGDDVYDFSYGVYIDVVASQQTFRLARYSTDPDGTDPNQKEVVEEYQLPERMEFVDFCLFDLDLDETGADCSSEDGGIILFTRPNPDANFFTSDGDSRINENNVAVIIENDEGMSRAIITNVTGYIYVD